MEFRVSLSFEILRVTDFCWSRSNSAKTEEEEEATSTFS
jgi:hypothetical protein